MKHLRVLFLLTSFAVLAGSCKKDKDDNPTPTPAAAQLSMKVNNAAWFDDGVTEAVYITNPQNFNVFATSRDSLSDFRISINTNDTGTFLAGGGVGFAIYQVYSTTGQVTDYRASSGYIVVSQFDTTNKKVSGRYNLVVSKTGATPSSYTLSEGKFENIPLENLD
jgi:hypothetical protein